MRLRVVIDTNVVFEGLTQKRSASGLIIDLWFAKQLQVHVSTALAVEYLSVLSRKLGAPKWQKAKVALVVLLKEAAFTEIYYSWRPSSPDPGDKLVIDCAMNANALLITENIKDFRAAEQNLGLTVLKPVQFIAVLDKI